MTLIALYPSKKALKESIGQRFKYRETAIFYGLYEYRHNGTFTVCNRPHITGFGREWFGNVTVENDIIIKVS